MVFLAIVVRHQAEFDDAPFLSINEFSLILLIYVRRNLALIQFDTEVRDGEAANTLNQVYVDGKAREQGYLFPHSQAVLHGSRVLRNNLIEEGGKTTTVHHSFCVDETLEEVVLDEGRKITPRKQAVCGVRVFIDGHRGKVSANLTADILVHYALLK